MQEVKIVRFRGLGFKALEVELSRLAAVFRGTLPENRAAVAAQYRQLLHKLSEIGGDEALPLEDEMPDEDMPAWYQQKYPTLQMSPDDWER